MTYSAGVQEFQIDAEGYALIIGLVEERVNFDIRLTRESLSSEQQTAQKLATQSNGMFIGIRRHFNNNALNNLSTELNLKEQWLSNWRVAMASANPGISAERRVPVSTLISNYQRDISKRMKLYLILQEAVLIKLYTSIDGSSTTLSEMDTDRGVDYLTSLCSFPRETGRRILTDTDKFIRDTGNNHNRLVKYALGGALFAAITVGFAAPHIGAAVGGAVLGLHGAAAATAGLALLGGGAVAAHGLGIAGGLLVLVGGGALLGAASGAGIAKVAQLLESNPEIVVESMAKIVNYFRFLSTSAPKNDVHVNSIRDRIANEYLDFKHSFEREVMKSRKTNPTTELKAVRVIAQAYDRMVAVNRA